MTKVTTTTKYGGSAKDSRDGYKITAEAEISDEQRVVLDSTGFASILYRGGASVMNEILGVRSNSESEFSDKSASELVDGLVKWCAGEDSPLEGGFKARFTITRHVHGEGTTPVYKDEKAIVTRHIEAGDVREWVAGTIGFDTRDFTIENVELLKAVKAYKQRRLSEM